jgi:hypothetical protein
MSFSLFAPLLLVTCTQIEEALLLEKLKQMLLWEAVVGTGLTWRPTAARLMMASPPQPAIWEPNRRPTSSRFLIV